MDIMEILEKIRHRPAIYIDGDRSLKRVRSFMVGYEVGSASTPREFTDRDQFHQFDDWVARRLRYAESASGWCNMILGKAGSDEKAYEMFFQLLDEFKRQRATTSANPEK
jgi:hypothetical protein